MTNVLSFSYDVFLHFLMPQESTSSLPPPSESIYNHSFQLNGLKQEGRSDKRIEYLEDQVKIIPELEVHPFNIFGYSC